MEGKGEEDAAENVVRFPRDWVGPLEDLVPIGSRARVREDRDDGSDDGPAPIAADDFWSESASAVHDAIQGPTVQPAPAHRVRRPRLAVARGRLASVRSAVRWPVVTGAVAVVMVIAGATIGLTEGPSSSGAPATTTQDASVGGSASSSSSSAKTRITHHPRQLSHARDSSAKSQAKTAKNVLQHRASARHAHHSSHTRHTKPHPPPKRPEHVRRHSARTVVHQVTTVTVQAPTPTAITPAVTSSSPPVESAPPSVPAATSASSSGGGSSAGPAGPTGFGSAVGCNPKCS